MIKDPIVEESTDLVFQNNKIFIKGEEKTIYPVAVKWVRPIMERSIELITFDKGDILEIGFGMGIASDYIQEQNVRSHTILEINKHIYEKAVEWAKDKPNVEVIFGDWLMNLDKINSKKYSGIYYDTNSPNSNLFRKMVVDESIAEDGIFSYFYPNIDFCYHEMKNIDSFGYGKDLMVEFVELDRQDLDDNGYLKDCDFHEDYFATLPYVQYPLKYK